MVDAAALEEVNGFLTIENARELYRLPVGEICTWIPECKEKAIGKGMFASPNNSLWAVHDLCSRHANRPIEPEFVVPQPWGCSE